MNAECEEFYGLPVVTTWFKFQDFRTLSGVVKDISD